MASTISDIQKILVTLSERDLVIEPGSVAQLVVTMINRQDSPDRLLLEVEGVDVEWYAIPVPAVNVAAGEQASERILFKVSRSSENRAGSYPFLVRVQAMETGEVGIAQATLVVKPFDALQVELNPKRAIATFFHPLNDFDVTVGNLGNAEETLDLFASDPEDGCAYEFDTDRITLKPGQSEIVPMAVRPKVSAILGGMRLYGFTVSARSVEDSYIAANAHGQVEKRALISPLFGIFLLLLLFGGVGWWALRPRPVLPVVVHAFAVSQPHIMAGQGTTLTWDVSPNFRQIILQSRMSGSSVDVNNPGEQRNAVGSIVVTPEKTTTYTLLVRGLGNQKDIRKEVKVEVKPLPPAPKPQLRSFWADPPVIHQGESVMLHWEGRGASFILDPGNTTFGPYAASYPVTPDQDTDYTLRAIGEDSHVNPAEKSLSVHVVPKNVCIAEIKSFRAKNPDVYIGDKVRLQWITANARSVRIDNPGTPVGEVASPRSGSYSIAISEPTTFTLTATDSAGNSVMKTVTVTPKVRPIAPAPPPITQPSGDGTVPLAPNGPAPSTGTGTAP